MGPLKRLTGQAQLDPDSRQRNHLDGPSPEGRWRRGLPNVAIGIWHGDESGKGGARRSVLSR
jgi:hypothetical protein